MPKAGMPEDTRSRLLLAAGEEFSRVGYRSASLRDICAAAGVNVSSIKYYFGGKEGLYRQVWEVASRQMQSSEPMPSLGPGDDPELVLREFIAWFMRLVIVEGQAREWTGDLLAQEMIDPSPSAFRPFVEQCCVPVRDELQRLVGAIAGETVGRRRVDHLVYAIIAMCTSSKHYEQLYQGLGYEVPRTTAGVNRLASTVGDLAIGGLRAFRDPGER